jgi:manganese oxidase
MRAFAVAASTLLTALLLAGCTADDGDGGATSTTSRTTTTAVTVTVSATGTSTSPPSAAHISVVDNEFTDGTRTVAAGTSIRYTNDGDNAHTVTVHYAGNNGVGGDPATTYKHDPTLQKGEETTFTFSLPGTYHVFCRFHGTMTTGMTSTVTVQ